MPPHATGIDTGSAAGVDELRGVYATVHSSPPMRTPKVAAARGSSKVTSTSLVRATPAPSPSCFSSWLGLGFGLGLGLGFGLAQLHPHPMLQREARRVVCRGSAQRGELLDGVLLQHARRRVEGDLARQRLRALRRHRRPPPVDAARAAGLGGIGLGFGLGLGLGFG